MLDMGRYVVAAAVDVSMRVALSGRTAVVVVICKGGRGLSKTIGHLSGLFDHDVDDRTCKCLKAASRKSHIVPRLVEGLELQAS
jgi:hypothetical protein